MIADLNLRASRGAVQSCGSCGASCGGRKSIVAQSLRPFRKGKSGISGCPLKYQGTDWLNSPSHEPIV